MKRRTGTVLLRVGFVVCALTACGSDPSSAPGPADAAATNASSVDAALDAPRCTPVGNTSTCTCGSSPGQRTCLPSGRYTPCECADAGAPDAMPPMDAPAEAAGSDAPQDADPRASEVCRGVVTECGGRVVNVQIGERDGGLVHHCGACGVTCPVGSFCVACICER